MKNVRLINIITSYQFIVSYYRPNLFNFSSVVFHIMFKMYIHVYVMSLSLLYIYNFIEAPTSPDFRSSSPAPVAAPWEIYRHKNNPPAPKTSCLAAGFVSIDSSCC